MLAAQLLGLETVPVIRAGHLPPQEAQAYRIADNRLAELSDWDREKLARELGDLACIDIPLEVLGLTAFEVAEIDVLLDSIDDNPPDAADVVAPPEAGPSVPRLGDMWELGEHRLACGSSLDPKIYEPLLEKEKVRAVFSDAPYNVPINGHVSGLGKARHREFAMASGEMTEHEFTSFLTRYLALARQHSMEGALHYVCMDAAHGLEVLTAARRAGLTLKTTCTWAKTNAGMGSFYRQQTEFVRFQEWWR